MHQLLFLATSVLSAAEETGGAAEGTVGGIPTAAYGITAAIIFLAMFLVTISYSDRGIERPAQMHHGEAQALTAEEDEALAAYQAKHHQH